VAPLEGRTQRKKERAAVGGKGGCVAPPGRKKGTGGGGREGRCVGAAWKEKGTSGGGREGRRDGAAWKEKGTSGGGREGSRDGAAPSIKTTLSAAVARQLSAAPQRVNIVWSCLKKGTKKVPFSNIDNGEKVHT
jgi:uncharacterized protein (DUF736 family)